MHGATPISTLENVRESARPRAVAVLRGGTTVLLIAVLACGVAGVFGVHSTTASARGGGYELSLRYAQTARAGMDVPWSLTVRRAGGFDEPIVIAVTTGYFEMFETQGWSPEPSAETQDGDRSYMTFDPPPADTLTVDFDAYIQPSSQQGSDGSVSLWQNGTDLVTIPFTTWLAP